ncbi:MFS transporter [Necropsobacter massiliensis]|uniref:MFS transporter n=1 Tax=Necropsobacter massiliensis TaxID=1400001 RepID=UPI000596251C|nr:MFS transporter [Necropsobacter massiliensis]
MLRPYQCYLTIFLLGACALVCLYSTQPILQNIADWGGVGVESAALTISATTLGVALFAPFSGMLSGAFGRRKTIIIAVGALCLTTLLSVLSWNFLSLLFFRFIQGICIPFIFSNTVSYIAEQWEKREAVRFNSLYIAGTAFGGFSGRLLAGITVDFFHEWKLTFITLTLFLLLTFWLTIKYLPQEKQQYTGKTSHFVTDLKQILTDYKMLISCVIAFSLLFQQVGSFTFGSLYLASAPFYLSSIQVGLIFVVFLIPSLLTPMTAMMINRFGYVYAFLLSGALGLCGLYLTLSDTLSLVITGLTLSCVSVFFGQACGTSFIAKNSTYARATSVGVYLFSYYLGGCLGGIIPGKVYYLFGWAECVYLLMIMILLSCILALIGWRKQKEKSYV